MVVVDDVPHAGDPHVERPDSRGDENLCSAAIHTTKRTAGVALGGHRVADKPRGALRRRTVVRAGTGEVGLGGVEVVALPEDFDAFWRREHLRIVAFAYALTGSRSAAEDLAQDALAAAAASWSKLENPAAWVRRVVANRAVSRWRRQGREAKALSRLGRQRDSYALPEEDASFWDAVRRLPRRQAQVVALYYLDDLPVAEIAQTLGIAPGTVKATLHHARAALAQVLGCDDEDRR
jgi:RNA polymerase sigma factor (sigma-70 family)